jgi:hypothetical protein
MIRSTQPTGYRLLMRLETNKRYKIQIISQEISQKEPSENAWDILESLAGTIDATEDWSSEHEWVLSIGFGIIH